MIDKRGVSSAATDFRVNLHLHFIMWLCGSKCLCACVGGVEGEVY